MTASRTPPERRQPVLPTAAMLAQAWGYLGTLFRAMLARRRPVMLRTTAELAAFIATRSAFVAQITLYGYLRTRAGTRYTTLFENDDFVLSMNLAKWRIYLACLSDLTVHAAARITAGGPDAPAPATLARRCMALALEDAASQGLDSELRRPAMEDFERRLAETDWQTAGESEAAFTRSPQALLDWSPIAPELKEYDAGIVINSMRFKWQEVRRQLDGALRRSAFSGD